jgi:hypothetical protein
MLTPAFDQGCFSHIPGTSWVPDFSMWQVNNPDFPSGPPRQYISTTAEDKGCALCKRYVGGSGFEFWKTRRFYNYPTPSRKTQ